MARRPKEYVAFDNLVGKLIAVPKETLDKRLAEHREKSAQNPKKRGPKPKA